jgi:hypothetical protein
MQLSFNGTEIVGRQLHIKLADKASGDPYPVRMNEDGSYLHKYRGNNAFMTALGNLENFSMVEGKPLREVWLSLLNEHLANASE